MNKFKANQIVTFVNDFQKFRVVRVYKTESGYKYDVISLDGKNFVIAMPENVLEHEFDKLPDPIK